MRVWLSLYGLSHYLNGEERATSPSVFLFFRFHSLLPGFELCLSFSLLPVVGMFSNCVQVTGGGEGPPQQVKDLGSSFPGTGASLGGSASASSTESRVSRGEAAVGNHGSAPGGLVSNAGVQREDFSPSRQHSGPVVEGTTSTISEQQWRSISPRKNQQSLGATEVEDVQAGVPMGLVICVQPLSSGVLDGTQQQLMDALGTSVEQLLLSVLQVEWLRRDRTKKALQLELHRTVFQVSQKPKKRTLPFKPVYDTSLCKDKKPI